MTDLLEGEYEPGEWSWVREQVETYERTGGREANTLRDTGIPIVVITSKGSRSGKLRKAPVMRVEHDGRYAAVASKGGAPEHPGWYHNFLTHPTVQLQDGPEPRLYDARLVEGEERAEWWERAAAVFPSYDDYQASTEREIPVFVLEPFETPRPSAPQEPPFDD